MKKEIKEMQATNNLQQFEKIIQYIEKQQSFLEETKTELNKFFAYVKDVKVDITNMTTPDEKIKHLETELDKYEDMSSQVISINNKKEEIKKNAEEIIYNLSNMTFTVLEMHDDIVYKLMDLEDEKCNQKKNELKKLLKNEDLEAKQVVDRNEMKQIESWTNKKCREVIFDSNKDAWDKNTPCLHKTGS